jgi:signal transduction histidine kinase
VRYANLSAQRFAHGQQLKLRHGRPLPDLDGGALREAVADASRRGFLTETEVVLEDGRLVRIEGAVHGDLVSIWLEYESEVARRARAGEDFIVNAAHEFLTPLTSIAGAAHVLQEGAKDDPEARDRFLQHIADGAERLIRISRALLALARAEAGLEPPRLEVVRLEPLLAEALAAAAVPNPGAAMQGETAATAFADQDLLGIAVAALVQNAARHSPDHTVTVDVQKVDSEKVAIEIVNAGHALSDERLATLKTRFARSGGRDAEGFGVGLSIAERAVSLVDGVLTLRSVEGRTTARIELPAGVTPD